MYLAITSRPDIMYAAAYLSRVLDRPSEQTWKAAKRILRYLKGTKGMKLEYKRSNSKEIEGFSDADWAGDKSDRKSVSGSVVFFAGNLVSWQSKKQSCVSLSTAEAEYVAAASTAQDLINLRGIAQDFGINERTSLRMDNQGAISMVNSYENSKRGKHIEMKEHFIKDIARKKIIEVQYVSSKENLADIMTKALARDRFIELRKHISINSS